MGYSRAFAVADCAPWDGPAVTLYLLDTGFDSLPVAPMHLRLSIWKPAAETSGQTFRWPADAAQGAAVRCDTREECEPVREGTLRLGRLGPDSAVTGQVDLRFGGTDSIVGGFRATWISRRVMCG